MNALCNPSGDSQFLDHHGSSLPSLLLGCSLFERFNPIDGPEIMCQLLLLDVGIRHVEVALVSPIVTPGISHNEYLLGIIIANSSDCMPSPNLITLLWHHHHACLRGFGKACQDSEAKNKRISMIDASLHLR